MKPNKKLMQMFEEMHFDDYMVDQLLPKKDKIHTILKRMCKPPHHKEGQSHYDTHTKYGLLYTTFNTLKRKCNLPNYDVRQKFVQHYINDKKFKKLFKEWKKSGFVKEWKPSFHVVDMSKDNPIHPKNLKLDVYENNIRLAHSKRGTNVTYFRDAIHPTEIYNSIREAARALEISETTVRNHIKRKQTEYAVFRYTTPKDIKILGGNND